MLDMHTKPSDIMGISDSYTAFCFDEACAFIVRKIKDGEKPVVTIDSRGKKVYNRPSDLYKKYEQ